MLNSRIFMSRQKIICAYLSKNTVKVVMYDDQLILALLCSSLGSSCFCLLMYFSLIEKDLHNAVYLNHLKRLMVQFFFFVMNKLLVQLLFYLKM